ncbi:MAG: sigma-54-dependent Fis family transcriptional regulator [Gammaproteobacteria bacterium]|nr:sigma-54-dependent Fis family transcriptional regulator [Gammaproteobacteria bacterium]
MTVAHILVVDDEPDIRISIQDILLDEGYDVSVAESAEAAIELLESRRPDAILLDIWMQGIDGITLLREWVDGDGLPCPVIMISGHGSVETAVEATRLGAYDFIEKPISLAKLLVTIERALEVDKLQKENVGLRHQVHGMTEPIGRSAVMQGLREQAVRMAQHDGVVLIRGLTGSGRKVLAHYLHEHSLYKDGAFIDVSVASISKDDADKALFGSEDEEGVHYGLLEQANAGTLYLDDVADMNEQTQVYLLGALETRSFMRVGGKEAVRLNARIIAVTQHDLEDEVRQGRFREALYFRLNVLPLEVPELQGHSEDIPELLSYHVDFFVNQENLPYRHFSIAAQNRLRNYTWPGNIRELKNMVQRLLILGTGDEIGLDEVEAAISSLSGVHGSTVEMPISFDLPLREAREQFEKLYLERQLEQSGGSVGKLANISGMERTHLYRKLKSLGIDY